MSPMLYVLIFLATVLALEGIYLLIQGRRDQNQTSARRRLRKLAGVLQGPEAREQSILRGSEQGTFKETLRGMLPRAEAIELRLYRAGVTTTPTMLLLLSLGFAAGGWLIGVIFFQDAFRSLVLLSLGLLPWFQITRLARKRVDRFEAQFPEALELLTRGMRAGHSLTAGLQMVGQELPDPAGTEFSHVADEIKLGQDVRVALSGLAYRINTPDLPYFVTAISIQRETGGNLAEVLEKLGYIIRERFKLYGKVRALTAIGRASANLLAFWPFVMVGSMYLVNPGYVEPLWAEEVGHMMVLASAVLVAVGYVVCRKMATIEV